MATEHERAEKFDERFKFHRVRYPWVDWFNGNLWELKRGEDFLVTPQGLVAQAHRARHEFVNLRIRTKIEGDTVWIQAGVPPEEILI